MTERKLHKIDATGKAIGRIATQAALLLRGKNKPEFKPNLDEGDVVEVFNIDRVKFTGKKFEQKQYHRYSGYPGGMKNILMKNVKPTEILKRAVKQMLPANRLRNNMMKRLIVR